jgi:outer membrane protein
MGMSTKGIRILVGFLALSFVAGIGPAGAAEKIGVVDLQRCLAESKVGKRYKTEFSAKAEAADADLKKREGHLKELREALEKQSLVLAPSAKAEKEKEYREKLEAFKEQFRATQQALQKQDQELTGRIFRDLQAVVKEIGEAGGYGLIVERQEGGVLFIPKEADITDEVIRRYDQKGRAD